MVVKSMPQYLTERYKVWRANRYGPDKAWFANLAEGGQHPRAMVIACCDSRVDAYALFGAEPGELFMVRNVANLVPPYTRDHEHHGTSAAIEFAVTQLKVAHILVLGHAHCGGVAACHDMCSGEAPSLSEDSPFIARWMEILRPAYAHVADLKGARAMRVRALEQEGVLASLRNLEEFPFVAEAMKAGRLTLHGAWFDIGGGALYAYDPELERFEPV